MLKGIEFIIMNSPRGLMMCILRCSSCQVKTVWSFSSELSMWKSQISSFSTARPTMLQSVTEIKHFWPVSPWFYALHCCQMIGQLDIQYAWMCRCTGVQWMMVNEFQCYVLFNGVNTNVFMKDSVSFNTQTFRSAFCFSIKSKQSSLHHTKGWWCSLAHPYV